MIGKIMACVLALALLFPSNTAQAAFVTGGDLLRLCRMETKEANESCQGYVAGVVDYHNLIRSLGTAPSVDFCIPEDVSIAQVTDVVLEHLIKYPEHDNFIAAPAVAMALFLNFPCRYK